MNPTSRETSEESMAQDADGAEGTNALLSDILAVLKRIDRRLQVQDNRIESLEKIIDRCSHGTVASSRSNSIAPHAAIAGAYLPGTNPPKKLRVDSNALKEAEKRTRRLSWKGVSSQAKSINNEALDDKNDRINSIDVTLSRSGTWDTIPPPSMRSEHPEALSDLKEDNVNLYAKCPPPWRWISTKNLGRQLDTQYGLPEAETLWNKFVGDAWTIPPDGRVELSFQQHILERLTEDQAISLLEFLADVFNKLEYQDANDSMKRGSFKVSDFDFDPNYQESGVDYRADFSTGIYKARPLAHPRPDSAFKYSTAPWKRIIEIRGLSKWLTSKNPFAVKEHQGFSAGLRDPWVEALPGLSSICPLFTHRAGSSHLEDSSRGIERALRCHLICQPEVPLEDHNIYFNITFYEFIHVRNEKDHEDETWKVGRLHSDNASSNRRIRESACNIIVICDPDQPKRSEYWTSIYLCPFTFDLYEKVPSIIGTQDAPSIAADMIEFTMRMVVSRWSEISDYFAWLIGHRDALADPDTHDSLLFDDDSFTRSRRYFWAINYLAELDASIGMNIAELETWIADWPDHLNVPKKEMQAEVKSLPERLDQLKTLQEKLRALRLEAFALRDGLFSASGVIESRAATRLGENVKLLTFISIFFLPLSFCMSVWSISDSIFSLTSLAVVASLIPLATYLIVFNLNNIVRFCSGSYDKYKRKLVGQMKKDSDNKWSEWGKRFEIFRPKAEKIEPSDWIVVLFIFHKALRALGLGRMLREKNPRPRSSQAGKRVRQQLDLTILSQPNEVSTGEKLPEPKLTAAKRGSNIFDGFSKLGSIFRRGALVPPSVGV